MAIKTTHLSVKSLFEQCHTFQVPKYQRGYAWEEDAISDFIDDISKCLDSRLAGKKGRHHFFGGIVTTNKEIQNSCRSNFEVIDGQQRLASFTLFVAAIIKDVKKILEDLGKKASLDKDEKKSKAYFEQTIDTLTALYITYKDTIDLKYVEVPKLTLSEADDHFFQALISGDSIEPQRSSHERILDAWKRLEKFINQKVLVSSNALEKATNLNLITSVLGEDCTVIFMNSETRSEAYQIFQVLNDRGVHLTDGDMLRARTLELMDNDSLGTIQNKVSKYWDKILSFTPKNIDDYFRWYFSSVEGQRPKSTNLADQFLKSRFKCDDKNTLNDKEAKIILEEVKQLAAEFETLENLNDGEWPYSDHSTVTAWDRERLRMLVLHLKHTNAMPLLLSLCKLDAKKFAEAVAIIERFVFRYKTIGNAHIGPATALYLSHARMIRNDTKYKINKLREDLAALVEKSVPDKIFLEQLQLTKYSPRSGNGHIRYFFITLEDYYAWYEGGAQGQPKCKDKSRVFDYTTMTLEHIYPQNAEAADKEKGLEDIKHSIGNLAVFGPGDNDALGNKSFSAKKNTLKKSSLRLNREVGENKDWTIDLINKRAKDLAKMAAKIFIP